jgi:hypothetical protein
MGVDYSTTIGYGFVFDEDDLPNVLEALGKEDGYVGEEHVEPWLAENGLSLLEYDKVGDWMSGPAYILLCLKENHLRMGVYDRDGVYKMGNPTLSQEQRNQLGRLRYLLGAEDPQWVVSFNVS